MNRFETEPNTPLKAENSIVLHDIRQTVTIDPPYYWNSNMNVKTN